MSSENKALVLDFGGVISKTLFETHAETERALGLPSGSLTWKGPFDPDSDTLWVRMQNDKITEREYWLTRTREVGELVGQHWERISQFLRASRSGSPDEIIRPEVRELVKQARDLGAKVAVLSNELDLFYGAGFTEQCRFLADFDAIVDASYTEVLKPDARAYELCCEELGIPTGNCVFVDDQLRNVRGAIGAGMQAVHLDVSNPAAAFSQALTLLRGNTK